MYLLLSFFFDPNIISALSHHKSNFYRFIKRVPLVFAISSKMSSTPTQICLFRNYNYGGGEKRDTFVQDPIEAKEKLGLELEDDIFKLCMQLIN